MNSITEVLENVKTVAITGHVRPDGDCAGATLGLYNYIKENMPELDVDIYLEPISDSFRFLKGTNDIKTAKVEDKVYDVFFVLDCGDLERVADFTVKLIENAHNTVCIDHHMTSKGFAKVNHVLPKISSACEVLFELLCEGKISKNVAECLYLGMVHDTGVFKYQSVTRRTMEIAGILMEKGIDFTSIIDDTFYRKSYVQNKMMGIALCDSKLLLDGKLIYSYLPLETLKENNIPGRDLNGVIDQLRFTEGVEVAMFIYDLQDGSKKVSLRSVDKVDVNAIANEFMGGGHIRAAGFTVKMTCDEIIEKVSLLVNCQINGGVCV